MPWEKPSKRHLHSLHPPAEETVLHILHHLLSLDVLLQELIHRLHACPASLGNPLLATPVENLMAAALLGRHRVDDGFRSRKLLFVNFRLLHIFKGADTGKHTENLLHASQLPHLPKLIPEVFKS